MHYGTLLRHKINIHFLQKHMAAKAPGWRRYKILEDRMVPIQFPLSMLRQETHTEPVCHLVNTKVRMQQIQEEEERCIFPSPTRAVISASSVAPLSVVSAFMSIVCTSPSCLFWFRGTKENSRAGASNEDNRLYSRDDPHIITDLVALRHGGHGQGHHHRQQDQSLHVHHTGEGVKLTSKLQSSTFC